MSAVTPLVPYFAKVVDTWEKYAAAGTTYWSSTTVYTYTVPTGKRAFVYQIETFRSQAATVGVVKRDVSNNTTLNILTDGAATGHAVWPNTIVLVTQTAGGQCIILQAGEEIRIVFGAAQDTNAYCAVHGIEVDV